MEHVLIQYPTELIETTYEFKNTGTNSFCRCHRNKLKKNDNLTLPINYLCLLSDLAKIGMGGQGAGFGIVYHSSYNIKLYHWKQIKCHETSHNPQFLRVGY